MSSNISFWIQNCVYDAQQAYEVLAEVGYTYDWLTYGDLGGITARIDGRFFEPDPDGEFWVAQPVWVEQPTAFHYVEDPILEDIIVWKPMQPYIWHFLRGETGLILGEQNLIFAQLAGEKAVLHRTPLDWLKAGCAGSVLLDEYGLYRLLDVTEIVCADVKHGMEVKEKLNRYCLRQMPKFYVSSQGVQP